MPQTRRSRARSVTPQEDLSNNPAEEQKKDVASNSQLEVITENINDGPGETDSSHFEERATAGSEDTDNPIKEESSENDASDLGNAESVLPKSGGGNASDVIELNCQVCNCSFTNYHEHMSSEAHKASMNSKSENGGATLQSPNAKALPQKRLSGQQATKSSPPVKKIKIRDGEQSEIFACDVCNLRITRKQDFDHHLQGKRHNIAVQKAAGKSYCERCYLFFNTLTELKEHMDSQLHKNNTVDKKVDQKKFFCEVCQLSLIGETHHAQHLGSKRHKRMLENPKKLAKHPESKDSPNTPAPLKVNGQSAASAEEPKKKWLYVCNGCSYFTNDDGLLKAHMNQADHKTAVSKMKQAGLMCGTPASVTTPPSKGPQEQSISVAQPKEPTSTVKPASSVISKPPLTTNTTTKVAPKPSTANAPPSLQQVFKTGNNKPQALTALNNKGNPKKWQSSSGINPLPSLSGNSLNSISKPIHSSSVGGHGPQMRIPSLESSQGPSRHVGGDLGGNFGMNSRDRYESDFTGMLGDLYLNSLSKDFNKSVPREYQSGFRESFQGSGGVEARGNFMNLRRDMAGDLRDDFQGEFRTGMRRDTGEFRGDYGRGDLNGNRRIESRSDFVREGHADQRIGFRNEPNLGDLRGNFGGMMHDRRNEGMGESRNFDRDNCSDMYRPRGSQSGFPDTMGGSRGGNGNSYPLQGGMGQGPSANRHSSMFLPSDRFNPSHDHNRYGGGDYVSRYGPLRSDNFSSTVHFTGR